MPKRRIASHKGGRDKLVSARFTQQEKKRIKRLQDQHNMSMSDVIMLMVDKEEKALGLPDLG